jgi:hypothetical protein
LSGVNRSRMALMVTVFATALVLGSAVVGQAREQTTLFVPSQPLPGGGQVPGGGATVSCNSGPPFVLFLDPVTGGPTSGGTCTFEQFGRPGGNLVCDDPTTLFLRPPAGSPILDDVPLSAFVCSVPVEEEAQPSSSPAPINQEGDQESESGEVDQTFEVS